MQEDVREQSLRCPFELTQDRRKSVDSETAREQLVDRCVDFRDVDFAFQLRRGLFPEAFHLLAVTAPSNYVMSHSKDKIDLAAKSLALAAKVSESLQLVPEPSV